MRFHRVRLILVLTTIVVFQMSATRPTFAGLVLSITVDTSSISGQSGYLDFQFNPGDITAEAATATVTDFQQSGGLLSGSSVITGDASGTLPASLTLNNDTVYNDIFQGLTFGSNFNLTVTFTGQAVSYPGGTTGSSFALSLYGSDGITPLLTTDPNGSVATIVLNADDTTSAFTFPQGQSDSTPVATVTPISAVPEPSSLTLVICAAPLAGAVTWLRSKNRSSFLPFHRVSHPSHEQDTTGTVVADQEEK